MKTKHIILGFLTASLLPLSLSAQSATEAIRLSSSYDPQGSARFAALSGAMGAIGVEASSMVRNPAGIALYRGSTRLSLTLGGAPGTQDRSSWFGTRADRTGKASFLFNEGYIQMGTDRANRGPFSFAVGIRNSGRYERNIDISATTIGDVTSMADYAAARTNNARVDLDAARRYSASEINGWFNPSYLGTTAAFANQELPWMSVLGYGAGWISPMAGANGTSSARFGSGYQYRDAGAGGTTVPVIGIPQQARMNLRESGRLTDYDLAMGLEANDSWHFGAVVTLATYDYDLSSYYVENYRGQDFLSLANQRSITGVGARLGVGAIYEPIEGLRLGASVYTPTFYKSKMDFISEAQGRQEGMEPGAARTPSQAAAPFQLRTPWRFNLSGAYILGHLGFLSADYEYTNIGSTRLANDNDDYEGGASTYEGFETDNDQLKRLWGGQHTFRLGAEVMVNSRLALRGGYRTTSGALSSSFVRDGEVQTEAFVSGSQPSYTMPGRLTSWSVGAGWRITPSLSLDVAYVWRQQREQVYAFPMVNDYGTFLTASEDDLKAKKVQPETLGGMPAIDNKNIQHRAVATLTLRF